MTISLIRRLPDPATAHVEFPEYQRLRDEYLARMAERTVNDQAVQAHQRVERAAMEADRNAYAAAIRAGKPDPGQKFAEEWKATDARLRRKLAAEEQALAMIEGDIARALEQHAGKYAATVDVRIIEAQQDLRLAVEAYIEAREDLMAAEEYPDLPREPDPSGTPAVAPPEQGLGPVPPAERRTVRLGSGRRGDPRGRGSTGGEGGHAPRPRGHLRPEGRDRPGALTASTGEPSSAQASERGEGP